MSHPTPSEKPTNPENPRVFLDVDIGGERGLLVFKKCIISSHFPGRVSLADKWLPPVTSRNISLLLKRFLFQLASFKISILQRNIMNKYSSF